MMQSTFWRWLRPLSISAFARSEYAIDRAKVMIKYFYLVLPFIAFIFFQNWSLPNTRHNFDPLWPLFWQQALGLSEEVMIVCVRFLLIVATLCAVRWYERRWARALVAIGFWQAHALESSFGAMNHQLYLFLYISLIFSLLPNIWKSGGDVFEQRRIFLMVIWWAQAIALFVHSMSGFWKIVMGPIQALAGEVHNFAPYAFSYQVANWLPQLQHEALLGPFIIAHPYIAWPFYVGSIYFQFFALWAMIRPSLQQLWAFELVLFHIGTFLVMGISFDNFVLVYLLMFFSSPFTIPGTTWKQIALDLPIVGEVLGRWVWRSDAV